MMQDTGCQMQDAGLTGILHLLIFS